MKAAAENGTLMFGTVDTWLVWNLTGQGLILIIKCSQNMLHKVHKGANIVCEPFEFRKRKIETPQDG